MANGVVFCLLEHFTNFPDIVSEAITSQDEVIIEWPFILKVFQNETIPGTTLS